MKYLLCYTEKYDGDRNVKVESEAFDDFAEAVVRYTLMCGGRDNVVLANADDERIITQFSRSRSQDGTDAIPDTTFIR
ncbi:MAG: hypothetical protein IJU82_07550 [Ruminiclostridium sp.]|jgi:hypothetical protein|nr:hypothetical protein [Ruminiclostridium sp.]